MNHLNPLHRTLLIVLVVVSVHVASGTTRAATIYVNNRTGSDAYNGIRDEAINEKTGPVKSIRRALKLAGPSDVISLEIGRASCRERV